MLTNLVRPVLLAAVQDKHSTVDSEQDEVKSKFDDV